MRKSNTSNILHVTKKDANASRWGDMLADIEQEIALSKKRTRELQQAAAVVGRV